MVTSWSVQDTLSVCSTDSTAYEKGGPKPENLRAFSILKHQNVGALKIRTPFLLAGPKIHLGPKIGPEIGPYIGPYTGDIIGDIIGDISGTGGYFGYRRVFRVPEDIFWIFGLLDFWYLVLGTMDHGAMVHGTKY